MLCIFLIFTEHPWAAAFESSKKNSFSKIYLNDLDKMNILFHLKIISIVSVRS